ncbi:hypothetical protein KR222_011654 [Zaprionus bogoriensis]|nr:hypothetical protein KR222_011654 [Zaprionus bogoriensis]
MSKIPRAALIVLFGVLLCPAGYYVEGTCGHCYGSHACTGTSTGQICFDGVANANYNFTCPPETPICTQYGGMCMANATNVTPACGDTSLCEKCDSNQLFACTSRNTFGNCVNGVLQNPGRVTCPDGYVCSVAGAATGTPCVLTCDPDVLDTCDREDDGSTDVPSDDPTNGNSTTTATTTSTTAATPTDATAFCQLQQAAGRYAIPNDTVCTSFIHCSYKASAWQGSVVDCPTSKPYFNAANACGTVQPTAAGCL